jgi:hypothetical protein
VTPLGIIALAAVVFLGLVAAAPWVLMGLGRLQVVTPQRKQPLPPREPGTGRFQAERPSLRRDEDA